MSSFSKDHYISILGAIFSLIGASVAMFTIGEQSLYKRESLVYEKQLESLTNVEKSINALSAFVKDQKEKLQTSQAAIQQLHEEQNKLRPVVEADRKVVEALFEIQTEKQQKNIWLDRAFGFFIGIASSLVASLVWAYARRKSA